MITEDNKIVIANYGGVTLLPGGSMEKGEKQEETIIRELEEELGVIYNQNELKLKPKGVEFVYFPYNRGLSSTIIKEKCYLQENKND